VRAAVAGDAPAPPDTVLFERGQPGWLGSRAGAAQSALAEMLPAEAPLPPPVDSIVLAPPDRRRRGLDRISPSGLEGDARVRIHHWLQPETGDAALRGTVLHACLAEVVWADVPVPDLRLRAVVAEALRCHDQNGDPATWLAEFQRLLAKPWLQFQLSRQVYLQPESLGFTPSTARDIQRRQIQLSVETECPFAVRESEGLLSGNMDRLVVLRDGDEVVAADLIDFKTDALGGASDATIRERAEFYRPQILAYRRAAGQILRLPPDRIASRLLFVAAERAVVVA
jgi:hypothetical protein